MVRVLIVDDSVVVRRILQDRLRRENDIDVVGTAADPYEARLKIVALRPDVVILDVEMPRMDGLVFLQKLMRSAPLPVIVFSAFTPAGSDAAISALDHGAVEVVEKASTQDQLESQGAYLADLLRAASGAHVVRAKGSRRNRARVTAAVPTLAADRLIAIAASTGGPQALSLLLQRLPQQGPPIVIVQHMPAGFVEAFARHLSDVSSLPVAVASDEQRLERGQVLLSPGGRHLVVARVRDGWIARLEDRARVNHCIPSADVLFHSVAEQAGARAVGVVLTGMGRDGAEGLLAMRNAGAATLAQDQGTSVVWGMPKAAIDLDAVNAVLPIGDIPAAIVAALTPSVVSP